MAQSIHSYLSLYKNIQTIIRIRPDKNIIDILIAADERILKEPAPYIALHALDSSSVNVTIRVWVPTAEYWNVYFDMNKKIYDEFNKQGVNFPFPQLTIHQS